MKYYNLEHNYLIIDFFRIYSTVLVFFFHLKFIGFENGNYGIDIFFVISGFLITRIITQSSNKNNLNFFRNFILRRINRIYPALIITIFLTTIFGLALVGDETLNEISYSGIKSIYAISDYYYYFFGINYYDLLDHERFLLHTWTLSVELKFYLIFAVLFVFIRNKSINFILITISLLLIISILNTLYAYYYQENARAIFFLTPYRFYQFLFGSFAFLIHLKIGNSVAHNNRSLFFFIFLFIILNIVIFKDFNSVIFRNFSIAIIVFLQLSFVPKFQIVYSFYNIIKKISFSTYCIYLTHYPVIKFLIYLEFTKNELILYSFLLTAIFTIFINCLVKFINFKDIN
jgi:peptidoglycan/LPS O-acetylase OafA/YrhL